MTKLTDLGIREGSKKEKVAIVFLKDGKDAAVKRAKQLGLEESTARTWASSWNSANGSARRKPAKKAAAPAAKKAAKKAPATKAAKREKLAA